VFPALRESLARATTHSFRVCEFSVQEDHVHLIVEAATGEALRHGLQGLAIRAARATNRALSRAGPVWGDRHHVRALKTPRETRAAIVYVLQNWKKHIAATARPVQVDPCSSGVWFVGWAEPFKDLVPLSIPRPTAWPTTWLARLGWKRGGAVGFDEAPAERRARRRT
jgi:hypothetical protein